ncbi:500_t:CDS:10 [Ambispora gerdemannii]|uniref:Transcription elongation factor SPT5 n=1 Tax=Ambispora gerdemannii TaxID=144530 RepID=A0A9N9BAP1_9GLOM|nr:500_t:CDS:10 [Ambispora gerdemannii]
MQSEYDYMEEGKEAFGGEETTKLQKRDYESFESFVEEEAGEVENEEEEVEEEEDEEDEDEDDEYEEDGKKHKKRRKEPEFIAQDETEDAQDIDYMQSRHLELNRRRDEEEDFDPEALASELKSRHGRKRVTRATGTDLPSFAQIPDVHQPNIWVLKCKPGKEKEIVCYFMKKSVENEYSQHPLEILSVSYRESLKGYIYVEAWQLAHVIRAVTNVNNLYASKIQLVPLNERGQVFDVRKKQVDLVVGGWVRVKKGKFIGDLAQIVAVAESGDSCKVKLIRRALKDDDSKMPGGKRKKPSYSSSESRRGYIERDIKITNLEMTSPSMDEISQFHAAGNDEEVSKTLAETSLPAMVLRTDFEIGEEVETINLPKRSGIIERIEKNIVYFVGAFGRQMEEQITQLQKKFAVGDHVKVLNGKHRNVTGMVVSISGSIVTIVSDSTNENITVFSKDLRKAAEITRSNNTTLSKYELHDLVKIDQVSVGVIVHVEPGIFRILDQNEKLSSLEASQILYKVESKKQPVTDAKGNPLKTGDFVEEIDGDFREGSLLHLFKHFAFVKNRSGVENGGVFVTKFKSLLNKSTKSGTIAYDKLNPAIAASMNQRLPPPPPPPTRNPSFGNRGRGRGGHFGGGRGRRDELIDKTVTIIHGPYKGYIGIVKETSDSTARVELHTNSKIINVEKSKLQMRDQNGGSRPVSLEYGGGSSNYGSPAFSGSTWRPDRSSQWSGSRTPAWNSTMSPNPLISDGSRTPAIHLNDGSRTPAIHMNDGSRTPSWDLGSKTPAWGTDGSETPAWDSGSKTPRWADGSRTPAYSSDYPGSPATDSTTSFTAPTPAPDTPGFIAATPGVNTPSNYTAPTPGPFSAPTPAPFSAPTPAP